MNFSAFKNTLDNIVGQVYLTKFTEFINKLPCHHDIQYLEVDLKALYGPDVTIGYNTYLLADRLNKLDKKSELFSELLKFSDLPIMQKPSFVWFEADKMCLKSAGIHASVDHKGMFSSIVSNYEKNACITYSQLHGAKLEDIKFFVDTFYSHKHANEKIIHVSCLYRENQPTLKYHTLVEVDHIMTLLKHLKWNGNSKQLQKIVDQFKSTLFLTNIYIDFSIRNNKLVDILGFYISKQLFLNEDKKSKKTIINGINTFSSMCDDKKAQLELEVIESNFESQWLDLKLVLKGDQTNLKLYFGQKNGIPTK